MRVLTVDQGISSTRTTERLAAAIDGGLDMPGPISHRAPASEASAVFLEVADHRLAHRKIVFDPTA